MIQIKSVTHTHEDTPITHGVMRGRMYSTPGIVLWCTPAIAVDCNDYTAGGKIDCLRCLYRIDQFFEQVSATQESIRRRAL